ncbi:small-conductance mechanosensitive channel [Oceanobacillus damuensis]|uniref:small-conductance mechanosensitive channel n=1 Tax=Oceanobacillus damuensis TaxID=937928 RepID=UPI00082FA3FA|nr:small-conductance mechanosensitive channel [Oceanobacillus damuensis]
MSVEQVREFNSEQISEETFDKNTSMDEFHTKAHFWGRLTTWAVIALTVFLPIYLSFGLGYHPGWIVILNALAAYAGVIAVVWVLEPIMYFPILGVSGTYISFLTGNISNMCLPSAAAAQNAVGAEPGTEKGELTATLGIGAASLVNKVILIPIIIGGSVVIANIPQQLEGIFPLVLPAIFGAVLLQFAMKKPTYGGIALVIGLVVNLISMPVYLRNLICIVLVVLICIQLEKMKEKKQTQQ